MLFNVVRLLGPWSETDMPLLPRDCQPPPPDPQLTSATKQLTKEMALGMALGCTTRRAIGIN